jgi:hypothetical protein
MLSQWVFDALRRPEMQAAILTVAFEVMTRTISPRIKLNWAVSSQDAHLVPRPGAPANSVLPSPTILKRQIWVQNDGRAAAENVEVVLDHGPEHFDIWPHVDYSPATSSQGNLIISVALLDPRAYFVITMLDGTTELPAVTEVRCSDGTVTQCSTIDPKQVLTKHQLKIRQMVSLAGVFIFFFGAITMVQWII